jgi:hypothetical protein
MRSNSSASGFGLSSSESKDDAVVRASALPLVEAIEELGGVMRILLLAPATLPALREELERCGTRELKARVRRDTSALRETPDSACRASALVSASCLSLHTSRPPAPRRRYENSLSV